MRSGGDKRRLIDDIEEARAALAGIVHRTPVNPSATLAETTGGEVYLKLENLQRTGSFKLRGAYNKIRKIAPEDRARGVVAASAGNHAQGVALGARLAGCQATIVMPVGAPLSKVEAVRGYGAQLILHGKDYNEAEAKALEIQREQGATFVHAFNDADVIAGQGTVGLEILEDVPDVDVVLVGVGGGGLIAGLAAAVKAKRPQARIIGVEPAGAAKMAGALKAGKLVELERVGTIADGLATRRAGDLTFPLVQEHVDDVVLVDDDEIAAAILFLLERAKTVTEGAGAAALAALLAGKVDVRGKKAVVVLSGGNIDVTLLDNIIQRGLLRTGRTLIFSTVLTDKPGALRDLMSLLADARANVELVEHDRTSLNVHVTEAEVKIKVDTRGPEHVQEILATLAKKGYRVTSHEP